MEFDVVVIGAGHNGLICAAYLLKAGYRVLLLEKREFPGGGATTEELLPEEAPGFRFNPCAIDHIFIHLGPVVKELELHRYGLEYLFCDPVVFCPHPDGKYFLAHRSVEKTCAEIARYSDRDAQKYAEFTDFWQRVIGMLTPAFNAPPKSIVDILGNYDIGKIKDVFSLVGSPNKTLDLIRIFRPLPELANYSTPIAGLFLTGAGTHPGGSVSGMPGRNCARVFLQHQRSLTQTLTNAGNSLKSTAKSVFNLH